MSLRGVFFDFSAFSSPVRSLLFSRVNYGGSSGFEGAKTPDELEKEADEILRQNGYTKSGQQRKKGEASREAYRQSRFERSQIPTGFRGASRKNR